MIPWLLVTELLVQRGQSLSSLIAERMAKFPCSGEINRTIAEPKRVIAAVEQAYGAGALETDYTDGLSLSFEQWRLNLRMSNTEPVVRLNVESRADVALMREKADELLAFMEAQG